MTTRLYFLVDDEAAARAVVDGLKARGLGEDDVSVVAHRERYPLQGLPEGGIAERTDVLPAAGRGAAAGATTLLAGLAAGAALAPGMVVAGPGALAAMTAAGAAFGTWSATLIGVGVLHRDLKPFEESIEAGRILVLVDVAAEEVDAVTETIRREAGDVVISQGDLAQAS
ncbi:MAG: hypothetical protein V2J24_06780 [Pseudomonadales bacterium]|jgi:hypothetical protein|nr:hypothetical protein [Pseudomonadales bacterium]